MNISKLTKPQIIAAYNAVVAELDTLRTINAAHQTLVISARERIAAAEAELASRTAAPKRSSSFTPYTAEQRAEWKAKQIAALPAKPAKPAYIKPAYVMPAWQQERAAAMAEAKAYAMATGACVKVQS